VATNPNPAQRAVTASGQPIHVGTSGFAYPAWKPSFYPKKVPPKDFLTYYAGHFDTTEINNTFYRFPRVNVTEAWYREVPAGFSFTVKMTQKVSHVKRLKDVEREMGWFLEGVLPLQEKLGPVLVQLPPNLRQDLGLLDAFLARNAPRLRLALEFRHASWFDDAVYETLRRHAAALAIVEPEEEDGALPVVRAVTGPFVYVRLRKGEYAAAELQEWADWLRAQAVEAYAYLKHEDHGPALAQALLQRLVAR
jgi:uncharacterized protein YecE (DUF72 family)